MSQRKPTVNKSIGMLFGASKETVQHARAALNDILRSNNAGATKIAAIETLRQLCKVENISVTGCTINTDATS